MWLTPNRSAVLCCDSLAPGAMSPCKISDRSSEATRIAALSYAIQPPRILFLTHVYALDLGRSQSILDLSIKGDSTEVEWILLSHPSVRTESIRDSPFTWILNLLTIDLAASNRTRRRILPIKDGAGNRADRASGPLRVARRDSLTANRGRNHGVHQRLCASQPGGKNQQQGLQMHLPSAVGRL